MQHLLWQPRKQTPSWLHQVQHRQLVKSSNYPSVFMLVQPHFVSSVQLWTSQRRHHFLPVLPQRPLVEPVSFFSLFFKKTYREREYFRQCNNKNNLCITDNKISPASNDSWSWVQRAAYNQRDRLPTCQKIFSTEFEVCTKNKGREWGRGWGRRVHGSI